MSLTGRWIKPPNLLSPEQFRSCSRSLQCTGGKIVPPALLGREPGPPSPPFPLQLLLSSSFCLLYIFKLPEEINTVLRTIEFGSPPPCKGRGHVSSPSFPSGHGGALPLQGGGELGPPACTSANSAACMSSTHPKATDPSQMPPAHSRQGPLGPCTSTSSSGSTGSNWGPLQINGTSYSSWGLGPCRQAHTSRSYLSSIRHSHLLARQTAPWPLQSASTPQPEHLSTLRHWPEALPLPHCPSPESHPLSAPWPPRLSHLSFWPPPS